MVESNINSSNAAEAHALFRGSAELAKNYRAAAAAFDFIATVVAVGTFAGATVSARWQPLMALALLVAAQVVRYAGSSAAAYSERARRLSLQAFARGVELDAWQLVQLRAEAPTGSERLARRLPAGSLDDYYEPDCPPGDRRLRELYAHSAFYTWRLLRAYARILWGCAAVLLLVTFGAMYYLVAQATPVDVAAAVLEALSTVVVAVLGLKTLDGALEAGSSSEASRKIVESLTQAGGSHSVAHVAAEYDVERAKGSSVPTPLYRVLRDRLQRDWHELRRVFRCA